MAADVTLFITDVKLAAHRNLEGIVKLATYTIYKVYYILYR